MRVLVACEESQIVTIAFRAMGHEAFSCDLQKCSGGHPEWHIQDDAIKVAYSGSWDLMIAHPPCTYLAVSGALWYYHPDDKHLPFEQRRPHPRYPNRQKDKDDAIKFFMAMVNAPIDKICIENPVGIMSTVYKKADQIIQPYYFGDTSRKTTCLWLKNLPKLVYVLRDNLFELQTSVEPDIYTCSNGKTFSRDYMVALSADEKRGGLRSKTYPGIAKAIATQWS